MLEVDAVLFDLDHTLFDRAAVVRTYWRDVLERAGLDADEERCQRLVAADTGERGRLPVLLGILQTDVGLSVADLAAVRRSYPWRVVAHLPTGIKLRALVNQIAANHRVGVVTNGNSALQHAKLVALGMENTFEAVVISGEVGLEKPDPAIFRLAVERLGVASHRALMVGDDPERDIAGAAAAGLRTCWLRRDVSIPVPAEADFVIRDLSELPRVLACSTPRP